MPAPGSFPEYQSSPRNTGRRRKKEEEEKEEKGLRVIIALEKLDDPPR